MTKIDVEGLPAMISAVEAELEKLPDYDYETRLAYRQAVREAVDRLSSLLGASWSEDWNRGISGTFALGGIRSMSASGVAGAMHNWLARARKAAGRVEA